METPKQIGETMKRLKLPASPQGLTKPDSARYSDIELTDDETAHALAVEREAKHYRQKHVEYAKKVYAEQQPVKHTLEQYKELMLKRANVVTGQYNFSEFTETLFHQLCLYCMKDESSIFSLRKGLCLVGGVGCGKTTLMKIFVRNPLQTYGMVSCRNVAHNYTKDGKEVIDKFSQHCYVPGWDNPYMHEHQGICFDDLGTETTKKFFGNESNVMADILLNRYDNLAFTETHITTNLTANQIEDFYGTRLRSRFREMFNVIEFPKEAGDLRK